MQQASALQGLAAMVRRWDDKGPTSSALPLALAAQVLAPAAGADAATALGDDGWPDFMAMLGRPSAKPRSASKALQALSIFFLLFFAHDLGTHLCSLCAGRAVGGACHL